MRGYKKIKMERQEINSLIDADITNKVAVGSISPGIDGENRKAMLDYVDSRIDEIEQIPGPQGPQGLQGVPGPVGPAGLEWKGQWNAETSYIEDDAVGFGGASWFCVQGVEGNESNLPPNEDTQSWALLAAQGAQGIQGVQGPPGPGISPKTSGTVSVSGVLQILPFDINFLTGSGNGQVALPTTTEIGKKIIVTGGPQNTSILAGESGTNFIRVAYQAQVSSILIQNLECYEFTLLITTAGGRFWLAQKIERGDKEAVFPLFQENTSNPVAQTALKNNFSLPALQGSVGRTFVFSRLGVGEYQIEVRWNPTTHPTNSNRLGVFFGDSTIKFEGGVTTGSMPNFDFKRWLFSTYNNSGVKSDNMLLGGNGGYFTIKLYDTNF